MSTAPSRSKAGTEKPANWWRHSGSGPKTGTLRRTKGSRWIGRGRARAVEKVHPVDPPHPGSAVDRVEIEVHEQDHTRVSFSLFIPRKGPYALNLKSTNGRCRAANLLAKSAEITTLNGSVAVSQA